jgi:hypothetical protein
LGSAPEPGDLRNRLLQRIAHGAGDSRDEAVFDTLALDVFAHQFERNPIYRAYAESRGGVPGRVHRWLDIPAVPTEAFRAADLLCGDPADAERVFRTSGTTGGRERRGTHYMLDTSLYRAALRASFAPALIPDLKGIDILALVPPPSTAPDSSLSFMVGEVIESYGGPGSAYLVPASGPPGDALVGALEAAATRGRPVLLVGTSFSFVHLLDLLDGAARRLTLPEGSRAMDTGGFKGRSREVERGELYASIERVLGIDRRWIVNEYGMTEMSSQLYDGVAGSAGPVEARRHAAPPWIRSVAVDPETLEPLAAGRLGILRHLDLANLDSVAAIQTADLGEVDEQGRVRLHGRLTGAPPRGCSIAMDELLNVLKER